MAKKRSWDGKIGHQYIDRGPEVLVSVGVDSLTYVEFVKKTEKVNFPAVRNLDKAIQTFKPKSVREVARRIDLFKLKAAGNIGDTAVMVWCWIMDIHGVDANRWLGKGVNKRGKKRKR